MKLNETEMELVLKTELFRGSPPSVLTRILAVSDCTAADYEKNDVVYDKTNFSRSLGIVLEYGAYTAENLRSYNARVTARALECALGNGVGKVG